MYPAARPLFCLFLAAILLLAAGCTTARNDTAPEPLARFALAKEDLPFTVAGEEIHTMQDLKPDNVFSGVVRPVDYYVVVSFEGEWPLRTGQMVKQEIYEFESAGDAEKVFSAHLDKLVVVFDSEYYKAVTISRSPEISVGDRCVAYTIRDPRDPAKDTASNVVFTRGNHLEMIVLFSPQEDPGTVADLAKKADLLIAERRPAGNATATPPGYSEPEG
jgi:hypothetical protein